MKQVAGITFMQQVKTIRDISLYNKRVLIRVDFNVPMDEDFNISDDTRIREALPTINYCIDNDPQSIILISHLGRPKGIQPEFSLKHILKRLERLLDKSILFADSIESTLELQKTRQLEVLFCLKIYDFIRVKKKTTQP